MSLVFDTKINNENLVQSIESNETTAIDDTATPASISKSMKKKIWTDKSNAILQPEKSNAFDDELVLRVRLLPPPRCPFDEKTQPFEVIEWQKQRIFSLEGDVSCLSSLVNNPEIEPEKLNEDSKVLKTADIVEPDDEVDTTYEEDTDEEDDIEALVPHNNCRPLDDSDISEYEDDPELFDTTTRQCPKDAKAWYKVTPTDMSNLVKAAVGAFIPLGSKRKAANADTLATFKKIEDLFKNSDQKGAFSDEN